MLTKRNGVAVQFGRKLAAARRRAGESQEAIAIGAGLHRTEIGLLERGERVPRIDTLLKLAGALGVKPGELLDDLPGWNPGELSLGGFD